MPSGFRLPRQPDLGLPPVGAHHRRRPAVDGQDRLCPEHRPARRRCRTDTSVGFFSMEMAKEQIVIRMLCADGRARHQEGPDGVHQRPGVREAQAERRDACPGPRSSSTKRPALTVMEMKAKARRLKMEQHLDIVFVDYIQLMRAGGRFENRNQEMSFISRSLKELAKELQHPRRRHLPAQPGAGEGAARAAAPALRPPGVRGHRAGRRRRHLHLPARSTTTRTTRASRAWPRSPSPSSGTARPATVQPGLHPGSTPGSPRWNSTPGRREHGRGPRIRRRDARSSSSSGRSRLLVTRTFRNFFRRPFERTRSSSSSSRRSASGPCPSSP